MKAIRIFPVLWAILIALGFGAVLMWSLGQSPAEVLSLLAHGTWGNGYGLGQVLFKATPLLFTGLSVGFALRVGLFNIGAEGQITVGALASALVGAALPASTPHLVAVALCLCAGFCGGAVVGAIPGALKATRGSHEVINTIMLNFIVRASMVGLGVRWFVKESVHTPPIGTASRLSRLGEIWPTFAGSAVNTSIFLAVVTCLLVWLFFARTRAGFALRAVGASPAAAETAGISVARCTFWAMTLAGGLAGLGGSNFVLGYKYYYEDGFSGGVGFMGIAVAVLALGHPVWMLLTALLFGTLSQGALAINALVPKELIDVLQAVIIFTVAAASAEARRIAPKIAAGAK